jgi:DNA-binding beta-propeller fold protein YncE
LARLTRGAFFALVLGFPWVTASLRAQSAAPPQDCNAPTGKPVAYVSLPGRPFGIAVSKDGCRVFVAVSRESTGIAVLRREGGNMKVERVVGLPGMPTEIVLTHDNKLLIVADGEGVTFLDAERLFQGGHDAVLGRIRDQEGDATINVNVTSDDRFLFVSNERAASITVIDLAKARAEGFQRSAIVGRVPVGVAPIALVFSPDEKLLYTTSEVVSRVLILNWPAVCRPEGRAARGGEHPEGAVFVIDVAKAETRPEKAVLGVVSAGCSPVRLAISPGGDFLYVTARNSNAMLCFKAAKVINDPQHALVGEVPVGVAPVPIMITADGSTILVGNSNRFASRPGDHQDITVIDAARVGDGKRAVLGKLPAQGFPRKLATSADGRTVFLSNFTSNTLEIIDVERISAATTKK